jgi:hypothetical protein
MFKHNRTKKLLMEGCINRPLWLEDGGKMEVLGTVQQCS